MLLNRNRVSILLCLIVAEACAVAFLDERMTLFWACENVAATCLACGVWCSKMNLASTHRQLVQAELIAAKARLNIGRVLIGMGTLMNVVSVIAALRS